MSGYSIKRQHKNVNSKALIENIESLINETVKSAGFAWESNTHRAAIVELIQDVLTEMYDSGLVYNYKVYSNEINNPPTGSPGTYILTVKFRQNNCINQTTLEYVVTKVY